MAKILTFPQTGDGGEVVQIPDEYANAGAKFVWQPRDARLREFGISEADVIFVVPSREPHAELPTICILRRNAMVKFVEQLGSGRYRLHAATEGVKPIDVFPGDDFTVMGYILGRSGATRRRRAGSE